jgi:hypothetical protein
LKTDPDGKEDPVTKKIENEGTRSVVDGISPEDKRLLVTVAGQVAAGLLMSPSPKVDSAAKIATVAVDIAAAILREVGLTVGAT